MKIQNTKRIGETVSAMRQDLTLADRVNNSLTYAVERGGVRPTDVEQFLDKARFYKDALIKNGAKWVTDDFAAMAAMLDEVFQAGDDIFKDGGEEAFVMEQLVRNCRVFDSDAFAGAEGSGKERTYEAYELFIYDEPFCAPGSPVILPRIGCFRAKTTVKGATPFELYTAKKFETSLKGKILTIGDKNDTIKPTNVEASKCTINDLSDINDGDYNYICINVSDLSMDDYLALNDTLRRFKRTAVKIIGAGRFITEIANFVGVEILYSYVRAAGMTPPEYPMATETDKKLRKTAENLMSRESITLPDQIMTYFNPSKIAELLRN